MNQRIGLGMLLAFVFIAFTQCTVQKRIYRKGYYISFNKTSQRTTKTIEEKQLAEFPIVDSTNTKTSFVQQKPQVALAELPGLTDSLRVPVLDETITSVGMTKSIGHLKETLESYIKQVALVSKIADETANEESHKKNLIATVVVTILLLILGLALLYLALVLSSSVLAVTAVIIGFAAIILLMVGLAGDDSANAEKAEKLKREKALKAKQQTDLSEEEWTELKQKQYKKAIRVTALLIVLFFAISLFAIAIGEPMPLIAITGAMFVIFIAFVWGTYKSKRPENPALKTER